MFCFLLLSFIAAGCVFCLTPDITLFQSLVVFTAPFLFLKLSGISVFVVFCHGGLLFGISVLDPTTGEGTAQGPRFVCVNVLSFKH